MRGTNNCVLCCDRIITLVALASYAHGKTKNVNLYCLFARTCISFFLFFFFWKCLLTTPPRFNIILIACFDRLRWGPIKGKFSKKKNILKALLRNCLGDEA